MKVRQLITLLSYEDPEAQVYFKEYLDKNISPYKLITGFKNPTPSDPKNGIILTNKELVS